MTNILLGEGLDNLKFGLTPDEVAALLGQADEIENESEIDTHHYDELELSLIFDKTQSNKLVTIASSNPELRLMEREVIGLSEGALLIAAEDMDLSDLSDENFTADTDAENMFTSNEYGISFYIDDEQVTEVIWTPHFDEEGEVIWP